MDQSLSRRKFFKLAAGAAALAAGAPVVVATPTVRLTDCVWEVQVTRFEWSPLIGQFLNFKDTEGVPVWKEGL